MSIKYYLRQLGVPVSADNKYAAQVKSNSTIHLSDLVDRVSERKTAIGKGDIASVIETLCEVMETEVTAGNIVHLGGIARLWPTIKGVFDTPSSPYDPATHSVSVAASVNSRLRKSVLDHATVERIETPAHNPTILEFTDVTTGTVNTDIAPGDMARLTGGNLNYDAIDPDQGLYYCDATGVAPDVKVTTIGQAGVKEVLFQTPAGVAGFTECYLEVRRKQTATGPIITGQSVNLTLD